MATPQGRDLIFTGEVKPDPKGWAGIRRQEEISGEVPGVEDTEPPGASLGQERAREPGMMACGASGGDGSSRRGLCAARGAGQPQVDSYKSSSHFPIVCSVRCWPSALQQTPKCCEVSVFSR